MNRRWRYEPSPRASACGICRKLSVMPSANLRNSGSLRTFAGASRSHCTSASATRADPVTIASRTATSTRSGGLVR